MSGIGSAVARLRNERGLTQQDLANRAGVSLEWVRGVEQGRVRNPRVGYIVRVADVLGVDPTNLARGEAVRTAEDARSPLSAEQIHTINASLVTMQSLSPRRLAEVQKMIEFFASLDQEEFESTVEGHE